MREILRIALVLFALVGAVFLSPINKVSAAEFEFATGYYLGKGTAQTISGLGFQPKFIMIRSTSTDVAAMKHADMPANTTQFFSGAGSDTATQITLNADGFSVGGTLGSVGGNNVIYNWMAVGESDCSATGTLCVGSYLGNGGGARDITVGFQPAAVIIKPQNASANFRTASLPANWAAFFDSSSNVTNGNLMQSFAATGFRVGTTNNTNAIAYYYVAFSNLSTKFFEGTYVGNGADNRNITGLSAKPEFLLIKNTSALSQSVFRINKMFGDLTAYIANSLTPIPNLIQNFLVDGFQVGTNFSVNNSGNNLYYMGLTGGNSLNQTSGSFNMNIGSYTGNGTTQNISNIGFNPNLAITKGNSWMTFNSTVAGTAYGLYLGVLSSNINNLAITLGTNAFSLGSNSTINGNGTTHYWQAFGNAFNPYSNTGAADFATGAYFGNGQANREINDIPFTPDFVLIKGLTGTNIANWKTSIDASGVTNFFGQQVSITDSSYIADLIPNGFRIGANASVNSNDILFSYFAFKLGDNFQFGTYTGNGVSGRNITTTANFQPDLLWVNPVTTNFAAMKASNISGLTTPTMGNTILATEGINSMGYNTFNIGNNASVNSNTVKYHWFAFNSKKYTQANYRFFENADSTLVGSPLEDISTPAITASAGDTFRLRMIIDVAQGNLLTSGLPLKLQVAKKGSGSCEIPQFAYSDVSSTSDIAFYDNPSTADKTQLTTSANDPTSANTLTTQQYVELNNFNNSFSAINSGQSGIYDFSLIDYAQEAFASYCFRMVYADNSRLLDTYSSYPMVSIEGEGGPVEIVLSFNISNNNLGFGKISHETTRYATNDGQGSLTDSADSLTITASTNAANGYQILANGTSMTCSNCSNFVEIEAVGGEAAAPITGTEQFGMRANTNLGNASITTPFNTANWAFEPSIFQEIAAGDGDEVESEIGIRFMTNAKELTPGGNYRANLQFVITANY